MHKQPCGTDEINFSLNVWLLAAGCFGLFYALFAFIIMVIAFACICFICCMLPILYIALLGKVLLYIGWAIVGILFLAFNQQLVSDCPVVYGFTIAAIVLLILDTIPTVRHIKIEESN